MTIDPTPQQDSPPYKDTMEQIFQELQRQEIVHLESNEHLRNRALAISLFAWGVVTFVATDGLFMLLSPDGFSKTPVLSLVIILAIIVLLVSLKNLYFFIRTHATSVGGNAERLVGDLWTKQGSETKQQLIVLLQDRVIEKREMNREFAQNYQDLFKLISLGIALFLFAYLLKAAFGN